MNKNIKIFLSYHKPSTILKNNIFTPIHVGREIGKQHSDYQWMKVNTIGDNTGENISAKNPNYCELTAQYWAWKNYDCDYIGFMHYRRHLNFRIDKKYPENKWGLSSEEYINQFYIDKYGLDEKNLQNLIPQYDILTVNPWNVKNAGSKNNYDHYKNSDSKLHIKDYDLALDILRKKYPEYIEDIEYYNNSKIGYYTNIFVMKKEIFNQYCSWLFDVLFELEKQIDISHYNFQEARIFGYISEWLFGIFITHIKRTTNLKIKELQRTIANDCSIIQEDNNINICFATDNNYMQHLGSTIASLLSNTKTKKTIDIYVLNDGTLSNKNKKRLNKVSQLKPNVNLYYLTIDKKIFKDFFIIPNSHFSTATYYRYIIPSMLPNISKLLYLDCDLIVKGDIEELYNTDIENYYIAAVQDIIGRENQTRLKLNKTNYYCNAGVLVMNLTKMRENKIQDKLIKCTEENKDIIWWQDQDVINMIMEGNIKYLDLSWNLQYFYSGSEMDFEWTEFEKAKKSPKIIHFIGYIKPWDTYSNRPNANEYFKYLKLTPWRMFCYTHQIKSFIRSLLCVINLPTYKIISILGIKIKIKNRHEIYKNEIVKLNRKIEDMNNIIQEQNCKINELKDLYENFSHSKNLTQENKIGN